MGLFPVNTCCNSIRLSAKTQSNEWQMSILFNLHRPLNPRPWIDTIQVCKKEWDVLISMLPQTIHIINLSNPKYWCESILFRIKNIFILVEFHINGGNVSRDGLPDCCPISLSPYVSLGIHEMCFFCKHRDA